MDRRKFLTATTQSCLATLALASSNVTVSCSSQKGKRKPNIIFILADDLGYGDLGCYGQKVIQTPNIDKLAVEGMRFTDHYAGSTVCAPSRCCLMTGLHTGHARVRGNARVPLEPEDLTVAELLKQAGYTTGLIGKWGLGEAGTTGIPNRQGFDYFFGYLNQRHAHSYYPKVLWRNEEKITLKNKVVRPRNGTSETDGGVATERVEYSHDLFAQDTLDFVQRNKDKPFFLYLAFTIPHANNEARYLNRHGMEVPDYGIYKDKDWPEPQKGHAAMITRMDRDVGRLVDKLKELGIDEDTVIFFSSDNGPHKEGGAKPEFFDSNGPLKGIKRDLYEGGIRVPMIARWPAKIKAGSTSAHISAFWDFLPTACGIAGLPISEDIDGISYLPTLLGKSRNQHDYLYWEFHERRASSQALRMGNWKVVRKDPNGPIELYDLNNDIREEDNIADKHEDIIKKAEKILDSVRTPSEHWSLKTASAE